jgi:preprotein translocase subunit SecG
LFNKQKKRILKDSIILITFSFRNSSFGTSSFTPDLCSLAAKLELRNEVVHARPPVPKTIQGLGMITALLYILLFFLAVFLIVLILVQRGKGGGLAGAFGGLGGQSAFGTKAGDLFTKITIGVVVVWIVVCLVAVKYLGTSSKISGGFGQGAEPPKKSASAPASPNKPAPASPTKPASEKK